LYQHTQVVNSTRTGFRRFRNSGADRRIGTQFSAGIPVRIPTGPPSSITVDPAVRMLSKLCQLERGGSSHNSTRTSYRQTFCGPYLLNLWSNRHEIFSRDNRPYSQQDCRVWLRWRKRFGRHPSCANNWSGATVPNIGLKWTPMQVRDRHRYSATRRRIDARFVPSCSAMKRASIDVSLLVMGVGSGVSDFADHVECRGYAGLGILSSRAAKVQNLNRTSHSNETCNACAHAEV